MNKIEHIGIAVKNLTTANKVYETLLNTKVYKEEEVVSEGVKTSFLKVGESNGMFNFIVKDIFYKLHAELIGSQLNLKLSCASASFEAGAEDLSLYNSVMEFLLDSYEFVYGN